MTLISVSQTLSQNRKAFPQETIHSSRGLVILLLFCILQTGHTFTTLNPLHGCATTERVGAALTRHSFGLSAHGRDNDTEQVEDTTRRQALLAAALTAGLLVSASPALAADTNDCGLEDLTLGNGQWKKLSDPHDTSSSSSRRTPQVPATFSTYATRFLINYDGGASNWWRGVNQSYSLLAEDERQARLGNSFGRLARSIQLAIHDFIGRDNNKSVQEGYSDLLQMFLTHYGTNSKEAKRHIGLLFAMLPEKYQPSTSMSEVAYTAKIAKGVVKAEVARDLPWDVTNPPPRIMMDDLTALLPDEFECVKVPNGKNVYTIYPPISLFEVGVDQEFGQTATATAAGPLASVPLKRDAPHFTASVYTLFGICGAAGCALTHSVVIPLDVVKTRIQTDPDTNTSGSLLESAKSIVAAEGIHGLMLGAQATIAGYMWYGLSVYPSYTFFKRWIGHSLLSPEIAMVQMNNVALAAGALAAVVASVGLTPMEAARIRTVAEPEIYRSKGLLGTLQVIATEDPSRGPWRTLYAGLPSLLTRQVIFGSVKFLAFEKACQAIFGAWPILHDATWTSLLVSLVAGGFSGTLSSVVSQPADSVLTFVAQNSGLGVIDGAKVLVEEEGAQSLFRGLGSRCVWAGSIIAGQFLLYDVFRTYFGVSGDDLSQIYEVVIPNGGSVGA